MTTRGFFRWVWRFNALAIAGFTLLVGGIALFLALSALIEDLRRESRREAAQPAQAPRTVEVDEDSQTRRTFYLGALRTVPGKQVVTIPLNVSIKEERGYISKSKGNETANLAFFDTETRKLSWLLDGRSAIIASQNRITGERRDRNGQRVVDAFAYLIVREDTDGNGRLTGADGGALTMSNADGSGLVTILEKVTRLSATERLDERTLLIMFADAEGSHVAAIDLPGFALRYRETIPLSP